MQKTRNLFILKGKPSDVEMVLGSLQFKGLTELDSHNITKEDIYREFKNNKSVVCSNCPKEFEQSAIKINVINSLYNTEIYDDYINLMSGGIPLKFWAIANAYNCDIGDHKSNSSGLNGTSNPYDCPYCRYFKFSNQYYTTFDINNRSIYQSDNFVVMPTLGEFIKGYLLIIPIKHAMSMAELSSDIQQEFLSVLEDIMQILKLTYHINDILVWENGTGNGGIGKAKNSIVHSHVHVAPSKLTAENINEISGFQLKKIPYSDLHLYGKHSYLLIKGNNDNEWFINDNPSLYIPRQYIRQLVADEYGLYEEDIWNWRINPFHYLITATCKDIQNALINNWSILPERIKQNTKRVLLKIS